MTRADFSLDYSLAAIELPPCPKCDGQMLFTGMVLGPPGFDIRSFECNACNYAEKVLVGTNMMGWINSSGLRPPR
jgi:hypothetical protein